MKQKQTKLMSSSVLHRGTAYVVALCMFMLCAPTVYADDVKSPITPAVTAAPITDATNKVTVTNDVQFDADDSAVVRAVVKALSAKHYRHLLIDNELSERMLNGYLKALDPGHAYFLQSDIKQLQDNWHDKLDEAVQSGDLKPALDIFNLYRKRATERAEQLLATLDKQYASFDYTVDESIPLDEEDSKWPATQADADNLWRLRVKNAALSLKLAGKKTDAEIVEILRKRFDGQLTRINKQTKADVLEIYLNSLTALWDPHTNYLSPASEDSFNIAMKLSLEGIGAVLQTEEEYTSIVRLMPGGPADKSGMLHPDDKITGVGQGLDGEMVDVIGWRIDEVVQLIRGPKDSTVRLEYIPAGEKIPRELVLQRKKIPLDDQAAKQRVFSVKQGDRDYKIGVITIPAFYMDFEAYQRGDDNYRSTTRDVEKLLTELSNEKIDGLIIDLRNNGGGSLMEATQLSALFIDNGPIVQIRESNNEISRRNRANGHTQYNGPLVLLINRMSASASEIFAGAIQDYQRGLLVGDQTYGKGTVQLMMDLDVGELKITQSKFYRVSGGSTQHRGIVPDIALPSPLDHNKIGESAQENALPWDQIHPAPHMTYFDTAKAIPQLEALHEKRAANDPLYHFSTEQIEYLKHMRDEKTLTVNLKKREQEKTESDKTVLDINNRLRKSRGEPLLDNIDALEKEISDMKKSEQVPIDRDYELQESGRILADFASMQIPSNMPPASIAVLPPVQ